MKLVAALLGGFFLTLAVFVTGALTAAYLMTPEPQGQRVSAADTRQTPVSQARAASAQNEEPKSAEEQQARVRVRAQEMTQPTDGGRVETSVEEEPLVDMMSTSSISNEAEDIAEEDIILRPRREAGVSAAHVEWCSRRYRSYRASDNTYRAYSGSRRTCESPHMDAASAFGPSDTDGETRASAFDRVLAANRSETQLGGGRLSTAHVRSCFERYRSYRPEDNSYQPYGGGPRRQCR